MIKCVKWPKSLRAYSSCSLPLGVDKMYGQCFDPAFLTIRDVLKSNIVEVENTKI